MNKKRRIVIFIIVIGISILGIFGFNYFDKSINGDPEKKRDTAQILKGKMQKKYDIVIENSEGFYTHTVGYGATLTTESGIIFDAWNRPNDIVDFYMEELWNKKGLDKWGYAEKFIEGVEEITLNIGYREEASRKISQLAKPIEEVKNDLWITIYVDLKDPFREEKAIEIEKGIFNYYQQLLKDNGEGIELIVRHDENSQKQETGSYMIVRDTNGKIPTIRDIDSISNTFFGG
ncbi:hypothetical protein FS935_00730 [Metabacillus litoralis]|uniref:Uncharacterized protein n=1 Tax=Metabacillus litoralis TaxID=152268 RepID=A0A5C6WA95_9BACI|nr:hypothetical protein [Metabacillus litoralis]TXC92762.1 hypothetical protein FS935_00730 [Metabacillus litoralis]